MQAVNAAWAVLGDPERRAKYDQTGDDRPERDPKEKARQTLASLFAEVLKAAPDSVDPVKHLMKELASNKDRADAELRTANKNAARMRSKAQRIKSKGADNVLAEVAESLAVEAERAKEMALEKLALVRDVKELLGDYSYEMSDEERNSRSPLFDMDEMMLAELMKTFGGFDPRGPRREAPGGAGAPPPKPDVTGESPPHRPFYRSKERW